jgi:hypothetical protein
LGATNVSTLVAIIVSAQATVSGEHSTGMRVVID